MTGAVMSGCRTDWGESKPTGCQPPCSGFAVASHEACDDGHVDISGCYVQQEGTRNNRAHYANAAGFQLFSYVHGVQQRWSIDDSTGYHVAHVPSDTHSPPASGWMDRCSGTWERGGLVVQRPSDGFSCITCDESYGAIGVGGSALQQPTCSGGTFVSGNVQCLPFCEDNDPEQCPRWAMEGRCERGDKLADCAFSCRAWEQASAGCTRPVDPNAALLRCTPCTASDDGAEITCTPDGETALDAEDCSRWRGFAKLDGSPGAIGRIFVPDVGWRDIPLGRPDLELDPQRGDRPYDRCEPIRGGPNFGPLGVPLPPNDESLADRYRVRCEMKTRECGGTHRSTERSGCNQQFFSLVLDFFMDCDEAYVGDSSRVPCRATTNHYTLSGDRDASQAFCHRGLASPMDPNLGFKWELPLCRWDPECVSMGVAVAARWAREVDKEAFELACCTISDVGELVSPDGSNDLQELCRSASPAASQAARLAVLCSPWVLVWAALCGFG